VRPPAADKQPLVKLASLLGGHRIGAVRRYAKNATNEQTANSHAAVVRIDKRDTRAASALHRAGGDSTSLRLTGQHGANRHVHNTPALQPAPPQQSATLQPRPECEHTSPHPLPTPASGRSNFEHFQPSQQHANGYRLSSNKSLKQPPEL